MLFDTDHAWKLPIKPLVIDIPDLQTTHGKDREAYIRTLPLAKTGKNWIKMFCEQEKITLLSDWGGVGLGVESAPLCTLVWIIVRNVEWVTGQHYLITVTRKLSIRGKYGNKSDGHTLYCTVQRLMSSVELSQLSDAAAEECFIRL